MKSLQACSDNLHWRRSLGVSMGSIFKIRQEQETREIVLIKAIFGS